MKRLILFALLILMIGANVLFAASVESYNILFPNRTGTVSDSTYAQMSAAAKAVDLWKSKAGTQQGSAVFPFECDRFRYTVSWTKTSDIDTLHVIVRTSSDLTNWVVADSQTSTATGVKTHVFTLSDTSATSLQRYVQIYAKLAAVDNANAIRWQNIGLTVIGWSWNGAAYIRKDLYTAGGEHGFVVGRMTE